MVDIHPIMHIKNHKLFSDDSNEQIEYVQTPNVSSTIKPTVIVIHYTAGRSFEKSLKTLTTKRKGSGNVSAHLLVGRNGRVAQMAPFNRKTWHAGASSWNGKDSVGGFSIGIELENYGVLKQRQNGKYYTYFGVEVSPEEVELAAHPHGGPVVAWHSYTSEQLDALEEIVETIFDHYPKIEEIVGHDDIAPGRKTDPGPAFPMASFRAKILGRQNEEEIAPASQAILVAQPPSPGFNGIPDFISFDPNTYHPGR